MAKKRKKEREKPTWKEFLGIGKDDKWKSDKDYRRTKSYWQNGRLQARNPAGYEKFQRREQDYLENKKNQKQQEGEKREKYTYGGRGSGEFEDIRTSLRDDAEKGRATAAEFRDKQPPSPLNRDILRDLRAKRDQGLVTDSRVNGRDISAAQQNIAKALGIKNVDSQNDLQRIQNYNASQTNNPNPMKEVSFSDEQRNIAKLLGIQVLDSANDLRQINQAQAAATALGIRAIDSQNDIRQIREYQAANPIEPKTPAAPVAPAAPVQPTLEDLLIQQQATFDARINELQGQLGQADQAYVNAQNQMQAQLQAATAATQSAEQRAANMRNAFIPQANPSAMSVAYGDQRKNNRSQANNQLSDLTIMSGLGTASNPLAGLQLA